MLAAILCLISHLKLPLIFFLDSQSVKLVEELLNGMHRPSRPRHGGTGEVCPAEGTQEAQFR